jgi:hypothetical protein
MKLTSAGTLWLAGCSHEPAIQVGLAVQVPASSLFFSGADPKVVEKMVKDRPELTTRFANPLK